MKITIMYHDSTTYLDRKYCKYCDIVKTNKSWNKNY
jgi:hypothetical protein